MKKGIVGALILLCLMAVGCDRSAAKGADEAATAESAALSVDEARSIAVKSACADKGEIGVTEGFNEHSRTWWFTLDMKPESAKDGCNPACVVSEETRAAEINWRCTGLKR